MTDDKKFETVMRMRRATSAAREEITREDDSHENVSAGLAGILGMFTERMLVCGATEEDVIRIVRDDLAVAPQRLEALKKAKREASAKMDHAEWKTL